MTTKSEGRCRIDGVEAGELSIVALGRQQHPQLTVKFALIDTERGERFGSGQVNTGWSDRTMELLKDLIASAEQDFVAMVFDGEGATTGSVREVDYAATGGVPEL